MSEDYGTQDVREQLSRAIRERDRYRQELDRLQKRVQKMAIPPLLLATVSRIVDENFVVIHTPSGNDFLVAYPFEEIKAGDTVGEIGRASCRERV